MNKTKLLLLCISLISLYPNIAHTRHHNAHHNHRKYRHHRSYRRNKYNHIKHNKKHVLDGWQNWNDGWWDISPTWYSGLDWTMLSPTAKLQAIENKIALILGKPRIRHFHNPVRVATLQSRRDNFKRKFGL